MFGISSAWFLPYSTLIWGGSAHSLQWITDLKITSSLHSLPGTLPPPHFLTIFSLAHSNTTVHNTLADSPLTTLTHHCVFCSFVLSCMPHIHIIKSTNMLSSYIRDVFLSSATESCRWTLSVVTLEHPFVSCQPLISPWNRPLALLHSDLKVH